MEKRNLNTSKKISIIALFSIIVFVSKIFLPSPIDKMMILFQALFYTLANLLIGGFGATATGAVSGLIIQLWRPGFAPFSFLFAFAYGFMIDIFIYLFKVKSSRIFNKWRLMLALSLASIIVGSLSTYVTITIGMMPPAYQIYMIILVAGVFNGTLAGYLATLIWDKYLLKRIR
ncbi:MAG: hypothetical protein ABDH32_07115 [Candidatus Caldarchaeales archaeon]